VVLAAVVSEAAAVLGLEPDRIDVHGELLDMGFTSLMAIEMRNRLQVLVGQELEPTMIYDYPSPHEVAKLLSSRLREDTTEQGDTNG
jgi:hypothetical protein